MGRVLDSRANTKRTPTVSSGGGRVLSGASSVLRPPTSNKVNLQNIEGLRDLADEKGIDTSVLPERGEDPKQIFSGGFIMDTFDALNALQYGTVGMAKGIGFAEGVKQRASFTDKDALGGKGFGSAALGLGLDIAFDPLTYIAPTTVFRKLGITKAAKGVKDTLGKIPVPFRKAKPLEGLNLKKNLEDQLGYMFVYRYGQDPVYKEMAERAILSKEKKVQAAVEMMRPISKLSSNAQKAIADARKAGDLSTLKPELLDLAKPAFEELDRLGKEAVDLGLLNRSVYEENMGKYLPRLYTKFEASDDVAREWFDSKKLSAVSERFKSRQDIPLEVREAMGEIMEAGYPTAKGLMQLTRSIENAKLFKQVDGTFAKQFASDAEAALNGFKKLPNTKRLSVLSDKYVPDFIADDIDEIIKQPNSFQKLTNPIVGTFKFSKVILNPATHARNMMSNMMLNSFEGMPPGHPAYIRGAREVAKKGKWYKEAHEQGLGLDSFAANEIGEFLNSPAVGKLGAGAKKSMKKLADFYQKEEEWAKMSQYIFQRTSKGLSPEDAWKVAEKATFNYAQVTPFIRHMRTAIYGMPFITFTYKATPQVAKTIVQNPNRLSVYGKIKEAVENQGDQEELAAERESEPQWVKDGFYVKLPGKDELGRSAYLDLTYIMPIGDLIGGNLFKKDINRETGFEEGRVDAIADNSLLFQMFSELKENQDFFGNRIYRESDPEWKQSVDIGRWLFTTFAPPIAPDALGIEGGFRDDGTRKPTQWQRVSDLERGGIEEGGKQTRTTGQEILRNVGLKINPVDLQLQQRFSADQELTGLETLLKDQGQLRSFDINFVPDDN